MENASSLMLIIVTSFSFLFSPLLPPSSCPGGDQLSEHSAGLQAIPWPGIFRPLRPVSQVQLGVQPGTDALWIHRYKSKIKNIMVLYLRLNR